MNTRFWGPGAWEFLHTITFNYPELIDEKDEDHIERRKYTKRLFLDLQYTLPCKYCRQSFKEFLKQEPLEPNLKSRADLTMWLYRVHNLVNDKLRKQELEAVEKKFDELQSAIDAGEISAAKAYKELQSFAMKTMITEEDPTFADVCIKYEDQRASCAKTKSSIASCRVTGAKR